MTNEANRLVESSTFDALGRLLTRTDAANESETFIYEAAGNLATYRDKRGQTAEFFYDEADRLVEIRYADGTTQTRGYDIASRLTEIRKGASLIRLEWDEAERLTKEITDNAAGHSEVTYAYDGLDRRTRRTLSVNGRAIDQADYGYDAAGRLATITYTAPGLGVLSPQATIYAYDPAGRMSQKRLPNGVRQLFMYDNADRPVGMQYRDNADVLVQELQYEYDGNGYVVERRRSGAASLPDTPMLAEYDVANRMTQVTLDPATPQARTYALTYDDEGNLARKENIADPNDVTTYTWDSRNRLAAITAPGIAASFVYDAVDRRVAKTINGQTIGYAYDGVQAIGEIANGRATATTLTGTDIDEAIARFTDSSQRVMLTDTLGSVIALGADNQSVSATYVYAPFGEVLTAGDAQTNSTQYTGRENDGTGLYFYRARYYDPALKRFIASDPVGLTDGLNTYVYVGNAPLNLKDPSGEIGVGGAAVSILTGWLIAKATGQCYGWKDALTDAALGFVGAGAWTKLGATGLKQGMKRAARGFPRNTEWVERSRWIPGKKPLHGPHADWNQKRIWGRDHAINDPARHQFMPEWWKKENSLNPPWQRAWNRTPDWFKGGAAGGVAGSPVVGTECPKCQ